MGETLLTLNGVAKSFKDVDALVRVDLEIKSGQVVGLVGGNGAGKTTLMQIYSLFNSAATCAEGQITNTECNCNPGFSGGGAWISGPTYPECVGS